MKNMEEKKKMINGGDVLVKCLLQENVRYMFGIPGGQFLKMYDAVYRWGREKGINTVLFRHEQAAAHAADAYARVSNTPGVCFGTVGPGATHLVPGVGAAWSDNIPVVAIVPQVHSKTEDNFTLQGGLDQVTMFKPITKYQKSIREIEMIPDAVHKVFREATSGRPRPVLLEIYEDAFLAEIEEDKIPIISSERYRAIAKPAIDNELIKKSLDLLLNAEKPLIVSGGGVMRAEAWNELQEFAEYLQIPVITSITGIGTISNKSKCAIGATVGSITLSAAQVDVILALGCKFSFTMAFGAEPFWKNSQKLIQVDIDPTIIGRNKPIDLGIVGDCKLFLKQLLEEVKKTQKVEKREWLDYLIGLKQRLHTNYIKKSSKDRTPIIPQRMIKEVLEFIDEDAILIVDGGDIQAFTYEQINVYKERKPLSTLSSIGMGHLGTSVGYGIGAKLAKPDKQVVSISGDGSFMINIQDLETAVRLGLKNLIFCIANNNCWGMIKSGQKYSLKKRYIDVDLPEFDYGKCAEGFGCYGEQVTDPNEIKPALERAKNSNKPAVLDIKIQFATAEITKLMASIGSL
ncbi:MAG: thiamine pyrophosphate-binding protein [Promethearchaeota archaeon]|nr:MAG: thiamine pyrophosphate-binding protein [Candidatus Lokiarchaeota archaeon]